MIRDRRGMGWLGWLIVLVIVTSVFWGAYIAWLAPNLPAPYTPPIAENKDYVEVDYRGFFPGTGKTFDTSIEAVAKDNATYPKAASFTWRYGAGSYKVLDFVVGCIGGSGCPIEGFQEPVLGMRVGETRSVEIPPEKGYGAADPTKIVVRNLLEEVTATMTMNGTQFQSRFGLTAQEGSVVTDTDWGWNATVHVVGDIVTVRASPTLHEVITVGSKWPAEVVAIDDGADGGLGVITLRHRLTQADVNAYVAVNHVGNFIITALDTVAGTFTVDYNQEVIGKTLAFEITLVSLRKANP